MTQHERRLSMALDDAYHYCRRLEAREENPELFHLMAALHTVDAALQSAEEGQEPRLGPRISCEAWSRVRDSLYDFLVTSTPGYFLVYANDDATPCEAGNQWPDKGLLEFYPESGRRREDRFTSNLDNLDPGTKTTLRWLFAEGRQNVRPSDFSKQPIVLEEEEANELLDRLYLVCAEEAARGKKRAHQKWWQLYWEASSCRDNQEKRRLHKDMDRLQAVWGRPS